MGYWYFRNTYKHLIFKTLIYSIFLLIINKLAGNIVNYGSRGCRFESYRGHEGNSRNVVPFFNYQTFIFNPYYIFLFDNSVVFLSSSFICVLLSYKKFKICKLNLHDRKTKNY